MASESSKAPRERLLSAANRLFYQEGIHTVGIDRVIEAAGVAKASLYSSFGSKSELVQAYLSQRKEAQQKRITAAIARSESPRERILAVFDSLAEATAQPGFRGCAFMRASAEGELEAGTKAVCEETRAWLRNTFVELAKAAGMADAKRMGQQLALLYDGAVVSAHMDRNLSAAAAARDVAEMILESASLRSRVAARVTARAQKRPRTK